jgi:Zn-dependent protease
MLDFDPLVMISRLLILAIAFPVHEFAHAWVATWFGDPTPRLQGRLTLSPAAHLDLFGSLTLLLAGFGWAKPVMVDVYRLRRSSRSAFMWVSLAGPLSNLLLALLAVPVFRFNLLPLPFEPTGDFGIDMASQVLFEFMAINLLLMLFNLIPLAPLDGEKVLEFFLPPELAMRFEQFRPYSPIVLIAIAFLLPAVGINVLDQILYQPLWALLDFLVI